MVNEGQGLRVFLEWSLALSQNSHTQQKGGLGMPAPQKISSRNNVWEIFVGSQTFAKNIMKSENSEKI